MALVAQLTDLHLNAAELGRDPAEPTLLAMHHPPVRIGVAAIDALMLGDADTRSLASVLGRHPQVLGMACGHVHRGSSARLGSVPVRTGPSAWRQLALDFSAGPEQTAIRLSDEPPGYVLHRYADGALTTHVVTVV